ncbi:MAG: Y-family DNA polymerase, partial [Solirubrobacteraceae bacterium]
MSSIVCVLVPRFELVVAAGGRAGLLGEPAALAPEPGREQKVGEVSRAAEGFGIHAGMRMGEALARCPRLALVPPDPLGVADAWERVLERLEAMGARVEPGRPGLACFDARGLRRLHGGSLDGVLAAARAALAPSRPPRLVPRAQRTSDPAHLVRLGAGPSRFCAIVAAAARARPQAPGRVGGPGDLASEPVALLRHREELAALPAELERLGVGTLGELAALPRAAVADRFGR